jgi:hypothetical protein
LNRVKDQGTLLGAWRVVAAEPAVRLHIVGADTLGGVVQAQCAALGLGDHRSMAFCPRRAAPLYWSATVLSSPRARPWW